MTDVKALLQIGKDKCAKILSELGLTATLADVQLYAIPGHKNRSSFGYSFKFNDSKAVVRFMARSQTPNMPYAYEFCKDGDGDMAGQVDMSDPKAAEVLKWVIVTKYGAKEASVKKESLSRAEALATLREAAIQGYPFTTVPSGSLLEGDRLQAIRDWLASRKDRKGDAALTKGFDKKYGARSIRKFDDKDAARVIKGWFNNPNTNTKRMIASSNFDMHYIYNMFLSNTKFYGIEAEQFASVMDELIKGDPEMAAIIRSKGRAGYEGERDELIRRHNLAGGKNKLSDDEFKAALDELEKKYNKTSGSSSQSQQAPPGTGSGSSQSSSGASSSSAGGPSPSSGSTSSGGPSAAGGPSPSSVKPPSGAKKVTPDQMKDIVDSLSKGGIKPSEAIPKANEILRQFKTGALSNSEAVKELKKIQRNITMADAQDHDTINKVRGMIIKINNDEEPEEAKEEVDSAGASWKEKYNKLLDDVDMMLTDDNNNAILVHGSTGTGKTHDIRKMISEIVALLEKKSGEKLNVVEMTAPQSASIQGLETLFTEFSSQDADIVILDEADNILNKDSFSNIWKAAIGDKTSRKVPFITKSGTNEVEVKCKFIFITNEEITNKAISGRLSFVDYNFTLDEIVQKFKDTIDHAKMGITKDQFDEIVNDIVDIAEQDVGGITYRILERAVAYYKRDPNTWKSKIKIEIDKQRKASKA